MYAPMLERARGLPVRGLQTRVVMWHVFRDPERADEFASHIVLAEGQRVVGGVDRDSLGRLWWVGVEVDDLSLWGNIGAIHKHAQ